MTDLNILYQHYLKYPLVCTDTRNIKKQCIFFALKGDHFDGNAFAEQALNEGAAFAVIDNQNYQTDDRFILVEDVLQSLQNLAKFHRDQLNIPVIGLTGSNGKTTTKELINAILSQKFKTFATRGNLNNHIGVPLSILSIHPGVEITVIEMGANHQKEIDFLCDISKPTHGLITNIGMAHLDGFGGYEGVKKGKAELYAYLKHSNGTAFINRNDTSLTEMSASAQLNKLIYYGTEKENLISGNLEKSDPFIEMTWSNGTTSFSSTANLTGTYNFENILAAICVGYYFNVSPQEINKGLSDYFPVNNRSQLKKTEKNTVICDFYNANPSSMAAALNNLSMLSGNNKVVIIGDMFELGQESEEQHQFIAELTEKKNFNDLVFIGKHFYTLKDKFNGQFFISPQEAKEYLQAHEIKNSLILLKGSRGMALEQLLPVL